MALYGASPVTEDSYDWTIHQSMNEEYKDEQQGLSFDINYEFANGLKLRSITAAREWEAKSANGDVYTVAELVPGTIDYKTDTLSQEFHLMSAGNETVDWMAGLFYYQEDYDIDLSNYRRHRWPGFCGPLPGQYAARRDSHYVHSGIEEPGHFWAGYLEHQQDLEHHSGPALDR